MWGLIASPSDHGQLCARGEIIFVGGFLLVSPCKGCFDQPPNRLGAASVLFEARYLAFPLVGGLWVGRWPETPVFSL